MQITDEMIDAALDAYDAPRYAPCEKRMRAALEAALGARPTGDAPDLVVFFRRSADPTENEAAACIEDLAEALKDMTKTQAEWEEYVSQIIGRPIVPFERAIDRARATLERWGMK